MVIRKLLAMMAPIAPAAVAFQIHQVVPAFQINMLSRANRKKRILLFSLFANNNRGTQATKIRIVKPASGHAPTSKRPDRRLNIKDEFLFKKQVMIIWASSFKKGIKTG